MQDLFFWVVVIYIKGSMDVSMDVSNWGCHGASIGGMTHSFQGFHQWEWYRGMVWQLRVHKRCPSRLARLASSHTAAEGARVTPVEAMAVLRVGWQVAPRQLLVGGITGVVGECAAPGRSASSCSLKDRDRWLRGQRRVPQRLIQARV